MHTSTRATSTLMLGLCASLLALSPAAFARPHHGHGHGHDDDRHGGYDYARVVDVAPITKTVTVSTPRRECWDETVTVSGGGHASATPMVLGGIIGGAVGNQFGKGRGKDAMTVAGALLGASIGHDASREHAAPYTTTAERCEFSRDEYAEQRVVAYRVTYRYNGQLHTTRLPYDPGDRLRVRVNVEPDEDYRD